MANFLGGILDNVGTALNLPELGWSETYNDGKATQNTGRVDYLNIPGRQADGSYVRDGRTYQDPQYSIYQKAQANKNNSGWSMQDYQNRRAGNTTQSNGLIGDDSSTGGGGSGSGSGPSAADERVYYDDQINSLNQLLGLTNTQRDSGLQNLQDSFGSQSQRLNEQKQKTFAGYDEQSVESGQNKQRGVEQVDQFANNSHNSLQRLLQGGNAGNSSVGRELIPYLISKGAGQRRQGVFDQAGKNDQAIASARGDAQDQYRFSEEDLNNQRGNQERSFREGILNKQNELEGQKRGLEIQRAQATGQGYEAARAAGQSSQNSINDRMSQLNSLFGQYKPTFNARAMNLKTPELGQFTVDPAQIRNNNSGQPAESSYYINQLKRKEELNR